MLNQTQKDRAFYFEMYDMRSMHYETKIATPQHHVCSAFNQILDISEDAVKLPNDLTSFPTYASQSGSE
jgi:hypothetical protein